MAAKPHLARIWIDGRAFDVDPTRNLLHTCLSLGIDLPYFCWHPALGSVGACRQCAVKQLKDEHDRRGRIVMACMTQATEGTRIAVDDADVRAFRAEVIEWLMVSHPHDCPVCDEGGECHLQDMTVMTGHTYRRCRFPKRTYRNQELGPLVTHEMNRCIQCYRCVRYYRDHAGGRDLQDFGVHDRVYFGRERDGVLESPFAGNLVEVCPTGVFTDKTLRRHYVRKWDLQTAPSVCVHCGVGCNTIPGERRGVLRRIRNRYHPAVNGHFLCDRGRYGYEFVNHERRLRQPLAPAGESRPARLLSAAEAVQHLASFLAPGARVLGVGSPRASLESNLALRALVGPERFHLGVPAHEAEALAAVVEALRAVRSTPVREVERCDAALVLGEDVAATAPVLGLALRQCARVAPSRAAAALGIPAWHDLAVRTVVQGARGPLYLATPDATLVDDAAAGCVRATPDELLWLGVAVARELDPQAPAPDGQGSEALAQRAREIAAALRGAERPLVVAGTSLGEPALIHAAANVALALERARGDAAAGLSLCVPECNSVGLALLGGAPLEAAVEALVSGEAEALIVLESDLERRLGPADLRRLLGSGRRLCVLDHLAHDTAAQAELVLPAATFAESDGTLVSSEGRAQRFFQVFVPEGEVRSSWRWLAEAGRAAGRAEAEAWTSAEAVLAALAAPHPELAAAVRAAPPSSFRLHAAKIARQPHRASGRTAVPASHVQDGGAPPRDEESPFAFSMEGAYGTQVPGPLLPRYWAPGWSSEQALHRFQEEVDGALRGGAGGVRLLESAGGARPYHATTPALPGAATSGWRVIPIHHIFGSEEQSALAPGIAALTPAPYLALGPADASALGVGDGEEVEVLLEGGKRRLPLRVHAALAPGLLGLPVGLPGLASPLPERLEVRRP